MTGATQALQSFKSTSSEFGSNVNVLSFGFVPEAGYFIRNRLSVGGLVYADLERTMGEFGYSEYRFVFGPNVRYYLPREEDLQVFLFGFAGYGFVPNHQVIRFMGGPGINYFFTERIAFEARLLYSFAREWNREGGGHHNVHEITALIGISLFFSDLTFISNRGQLVE